METSDSTKSRSLQKEANDYIKALINIADDGKIVDFNDETCEIVPFGAKIGMTVDELKLTCGEPLWISGTYYFYHTKDMTSRHKTVEVWDGNKVKAIKIRCSCYNIDDFKKAVKELGLNLIKSRDMYRVYTPNDYIIFFVEEKWGNEICVRK